MVKPNSVVRFAPSPTGLLHVGNVRTALLNWLIAKRHGGTFILRLDDTDRQRSRPEYEAAIERDLAWLGLDWAREERQSERLAHYDAARDRLIAAGRLYPCYETPEELEFKRKRLLAQGRPPVYDRAALRLGDADRARLEGEGRRPHWRFKLVSEEVRWDDLVRGPQHIDEASQSDPVLVRADGTYLYSFTSVVDDIAFGVSHVIRGEDHVTNTAAQIQIFRALDAAVPAFAHLPLLVDAQGGGLSKRAGSLSIADLRARDIEALAICALLARLGTADPVEPVASLEALAATMDFKRVGRAAARFSEDELAHLSTRTLHLLPYAAVRDRVQGTIDEKLWLAVRGNLAKLSDVHAWAEIVDGSLVPVLEDPIFLEQAAARLPPEPWGETTWKEWTSAVSAATQRKGRALFHPLRLALTARETGPEMAKLLPLIGRAKAAARLSGMRA
jgi:glutamyl-tRNA synthetase